MTTPSEGTPRPAVVTQTPSNANGYWWGITEATGEVHNLRGNQVHLAGSLNKPDQGATGTVQYVSTRGHGGFQFTAE